MHDSWDYLEKAMEGERAPFIVSRSHGSVKPPGRGLIGLVFTMSGKDGTRPMARHSGQHRQ